MRLCNVRVVACAAIHGKAVVGAQLGRVVSELQGFRARSLYVAAETRVTVAVRHLLAWCSVSNVPTNVSRRAHIPAVGCEIVFARARTERQVLARECRWMRVTFASAHVYVAPEQHSVTRRMQLNKRARASTTSTRAEALPLSASAVRHLSDTNAGSLMLIRIFSYVCATSDEADVIWLVCRKWRQWGHIAAFNSLWSAIAQYYPLRGGVRCRATTLTHLPLTMDVEPELVLGSPHAPAIFLACCIDGRRRLVREFLDDRRVDPSVRGNTAITWAVYGGHTEVVRMLLADARVDPATVGDPHVNWNAHNSRLVDMIHKLDIANGNNVPRDPSTLNLFLVDWATANNSGAIVRLLLKDGRADPAGDRNLALYHAVVYNNVEAVRALLADARVDPSDNHHEAINDAAELGFADIFALLWGDARTHTTTTIDYDRLFRRAVLGDNGVIVSMIASDARSTINITTSLDYAARLGNLMSLRILLSLCKRAQPARSNALCLAVENNHADCVRVLLTDGRIDPNTVGVLDITWAMQQGYAETIRVLKDDPRMKPATLMRARRMVVHSQKK